MNRKLFYMRKIVSTGVVESLPFDAAHYRAAGIQPNTLGGMPVLEAFQLVNQWNVSQDKQTFVYALD